MNQNNIISLQREDAVRLSYDSGRQWQALLRAQANDIAAHMKIHPDRFRWYAAFHNESHHPHVHMVCWSTDPKEGYLSKQGIADIRSGLARQIFRQDLQHIYEQQTDRRGQLNTQSLDTMREMCAQIKTGTCGTPELERLILQLSKRLANTGGKKVYGFLKPDVKAIVDRIVDELAKDECVATCYDAWYDLREEVLRTYRDEMPTRAPLSSQKELKQIKNMVIAEVMSLGDPVFMEQPVSEYLPDAAEPSPDYDAPIMDDASELDVTGDDDQRSNPAPHVNWTPTYKRARAYLFGTPNEKPDFEKAWELFTDEAQRGNALAMHDLGKMYADGLGVEPDAEAAHDWYMKALAGFLQVESGMEPDDRKATYLRYRIGKMYMAGLGTEQDYTEAAAWLRQAADADHKYAQYSLASLYYRGQGVEQEYAAAFMLYSQSAAQDNAYASYELGKMNRDGIGTLKNDEESARHFEAAYRGFVVMEAESSDDKLQYRIAQMLRDGVGIEADPIEAEYYFERSAELGNPHAQYALAKLYLAGDDEEKIAVAIDLLRKSADGNNPTAQYALGKLYRDGTHMDKNVAHAVELFTKAADQKNDYAAYALGKLYLAGEDIPKDVPKAIRWLSESAGQRNQFALYALGKVYLAGEDAPKDVSTAIELLTESANQGNQFAQYQLGKLYIMGKDVERDRDEALCWFTMAAEQGNVNEHERQFMSSSHIRVAEYAQFFIDHIDEIGVCSPDLFLASTNLLRQLGRIFEQQQLGGQAAHIDRKRMRILREKLVMQGHARDEQVWGY